MRALAVFLPAEALLLLVAIGGVSIAVGLRRLGVGLVMAAIGAAVLPALLEPILDALPLLLLLLLAIGVALLAFRSLLEALVGREAAATALGSLTADAIKSVVRLVWRLPVLAFKALAAVTRLVLTVVRSTRW